MYTKENNFEQYEHFSRLSNLIKIEQHFNNFCNKRNSKKCYCTYLLSIQKWQNSMIVKTYLAKRKQKTGIFIIYIVPLTKENINTFLISLFYFQLLEPISSKDFSRINREIYPSFAFFLETFHFWNWIPFLWSLVLLAVI